jgi:hypothetical protein
VTMHFLQCSMHLPSLGRTNSEKSPHLVPESGLVVALLPGRGHDLLIDLDG